MKTILAVVAAITLYMPLYSQKIVQIKTYLDHRTSEVTAIAELNDTLYVSLYYGSVVLMDKDFKFISMCDGLHNYSVIEVFEYRGLMWALTRDFLLLSRSSNGRWNEYAELTGFPFRDADNILYFVEKGAITRVHEENGMPIKTSIGLIGSKPDSVWSIAVAADTVLVAYQNSTALSIQTLDGRSIKSDALAWQYKYRMYGLSDGSILVDKGNSTSVLAKGSIMNLQFKGFFYDSKLVHFLHPTNVLIGGKIGVVGSSSIDISLGNDTLRAFSVISAESGIERLDSLGEYVGWMPSIARVDGGWVQGLGGGIFVNAPDTQSVTRTVYMPGVDGPVGYQPLHPNKAQPSAFLFLRGDNSYVTIEVDSAADPFAYPFETLGPTPGFFRSMFEWDDGSSCAGFDYAMMFRPHPDSGWRITFQFNHGEGGQDSRCERFDNRTLVAQDSVRHVACSVDGGQTWKRSLIKNLRNRYSSSFANGDDLFLYDGNKILHTKISGMTDTVEANSTGITNGNKFNFLDADNESVRYIVCRSSTDQSWSPEFIDQFVVSRWFPQSGRLDSVVIQLSAPFHLWSTSDVFACVYNDTIMVWSNETSRFFRIAEDKLVLDKTIDVKRQRSLNRLSTVSHFLESNGTWWINYAHDVSVAFDVRYKPDTVTSVMGQDEAPTGIADIYPNPGSDQFIINFNECNDEAWSVRLIDMCGREVEYVSAVCNNGKIELPLAAHAPGMYYVKLESGQTTTCLLLSITR